MPYIKHFGEQSLEYLRYRPHYPEELYSYLASLTKTHDLALDCGTGTGQAALKLAEYFQKVIATDINQAQLDVALQKDNIEYLNANAEKSQVQAQSVDLIVIAQALHWFDFNDFYQEVRRVAKPDAIIAAWCYSLGKINPQIDRIIKKLYSEILGDIYWPKERRYIDDEYQTIPFPFPKITTPNFVIEKKLTYAELIGYLNTWSAVKEYQKHNPQSPLDFIVHNLQEAWGNLHNTHVMRWPIHLLVGKVEPQHVN